MGLGMAPERQAASLPNLQLSARHNVREISKKNMHHRVQKEHPQQHPQHRATKNTQKRTQQTRLIKAEQRA